MSETDSKPEKCPSCGSVDKQKLEGRCLDRLRQCLGQVKGGEPFYPPADHWHMKDSVATGAVTPQADPDEAKYMRCVTHNNKLPCSECVTPALFPPNIVEMLDRRAKEMAEPEGASPTPACPKCGEPFGETGDWDGVCIDCWPGYNLCADEACDHYRCEHLPAPDGCGNAGCKCAEFKEGSEHRVMNRKEFKALRESWEKKPAGEPEGAETAPITVDQFMAKYTSIADYPWSKEEAITRPGKGPWYDWLESDEGKQATDVGSVQWLNVGATQYLENRLWRAFTAGMKAGFEQGRAM